MMTTSIPIPPCTVHQYANEHELQRVGVWKLHHAETSASTPQAASHNHKIWIIYIHGGAWRDPRIDLHSFEPSIRQILDPSSPCASSLASIAGFASIDYRLSPHPDFPQDPIPQTAKTQFRGAKHPDHIWDVYQALLFLRETYGAGAEEEYVLVGHSVGATMALQVLAMKLCPRQNVEMTPRSAIIAKALLGPKFEDLGSAYKLKMPWAIIGLSGIYNYNKLVDRRGQAYAAFFEQANSDDRQLWEGLSPAFFCYHFDDDKDGNRKIPTKILLAWSPEDELVDGPEIDCMVPPLKNEGVDVMVMEDLEGRHDEIYENGTGVARTVGKILEFWAGVDR